MSLKGDNNNKVPTFMEHLPNVRLCVKSCVRVPHLILPALMIDEEMKVERHQVLSPRVIKQGVEPWPNSNSKVKMTSALGMSVVLSHPD